MLEGDEVVVAAWGTVALKMVMIHASTNSDEDRQARERVFKFISGKRECAWATEKSRRIAVRRQRWGHEFTSSRAKVR